MPAIESCVVAVDYAYPWDGLLARFKFRDEPGWCEPFARMMWQLPSAQQLLGLCDLIAPIPLTVQRLGERGYNQAWELVKALTGQATVARGHSARALPDALIRIGETADQHRLGRTERLRNLRSAFVAAPHHAPHLARAHVLLVDDVTTTGATLQTAAQALLQVGAARVSALVFARTPSDGPPAT